MQVKGDVGADRFQPLPSALGNRYLLLGLLSLLKCILKDTLEFISYFVVQSNQPVELFVQKLFNDWFDLGLLKDFAEDIGQSGFPAGKYPSPAPPDSQLRVQLLGREQDIFRVSFHRWVLGQSEDAEETIYYLLSIPFS